MATSYRIKVNLNNKSFFTTPDAASGTGATVIPADRGPMKPVKLGRGETERIVQLFGADRYETLEAIAYNNKYPLWISAPSVCGSTAAVLLTDEGLIPAPLSLDGGPDSLDFSDLRLQLAAGTGDGKTTAFGASVDARLLPPADGGNGYIPKVCVALEGECHDATTTWDAELPGGGFNIDGGELGSGILTFSDGKAAAKFTFAKPPAKGEKVAIRVATDVSDKAYAAIGMRFPCDDFLAVAVYKSEREGFLTLDVKTRKNGGYFARAGYPLEFSLERGATSAAGALVYAPVLMRDDDFLFIQPNDNVPMNVELWEGGSETPVDLEGGDRGARCGGTALVAGWEQFKEFKKYPADIYFDVTGEREIPMELSALRASIPYRRFLYPCPMTMKASEVEKPSVDDRGICAFWGAAYIINPYAKTGDLLSTLMGEVASRYADARVHSYGGRAVAWGDENQVGGQLSQGRVVKFLYDATEDEMRALDKLGVNPIVLNELFGPMVASRRTTDSSGSDYGYADYSMVVDYCLERIVTDVLPYQLIKFNDDDHRSVVAGKADAVLKPLTVAPNNVIRDYAVKCDGENNGDDILSQQMFVLTVAIKVTPKSEYIQFNFINSAQGGSVEDDVK